MAWLVLDSPGELLSTDWGQVLLVKVGAVTIVAGLGGCVVGNNSKFQRPTIGQELIDLQKAKESGAIDEAEYDRTRARILVKAGVSTKPASSSGG